MNTSPWSLTSAQFEALFPFHFVVDREDRLVYVGCGLRRWFDGEVSGAWPERFTIQRPVRGLQSFDEVERLQGSVIVGKFGDSQLPMRMQFLAQGDFGTFLGWPWISDIDQLANFEVSFDAFPPHCAITDYLLMMQTTKLSLTQATSLAQKLTEQAEELKRAKVEAEQSARAKSAFLATMSHEIRTPLNGILATSDLMLESEVDETLREELTCLRDSGRRLRMIVDDVLDLSKLEAGEFRIEANPFDPRQELLLVERLFAAGAEARGVEFRVHVDDAMPSRLVGDAARLSQILTNLISNALKFTEKGAVSLAVSVAQRNDEQVETEWVVTDSGIGIPEAAMATLFDRFSQADTSIRRRYGGTGLGLAICKGLSELLGGRLEVSSVVGEGSTFTLTIPFGRSQHEERDEEEIQIPEDWISEPILVVDDFPANRMIMKKLLARLGFTAVELAESGPEAIEACATQDFRLILMDLQMPDMDGFEATEVIRERSGERRPRIVALTAHALGEYRDQAEKAGMDGFLTKPITLDSLRRFLAENLPEYA